MCAARARADLCAATRAATSVIFAMITIPMLCLAGLVIDSGNIDAAQSALQGTADLAAIAAASTVAEARAAAVATAQSNGYAPEDMTQISFGIYTANPAVPPAQRFQPSPEPLANAVQVTLTHQQKLYFAPAFQMLSPGSQIASSRTLRAQAIAFVNRTASFAIGSTAASYNGGIINDMLGATLGGQVSLSLASYTLLAGTQVDLFGLANALSLQLGQVNATYGGAVNATISTSQFLAALASAVPSLAGALQPLQQAAYGQTTTVNLQQLIDFGPYATQLLSQPEPAVSATASALQLLQAAGELGGTAHLINLSLDPGITGIASVNMMMAIGEPAQGTTIYAVDRLGTSVHTSQIRLFLDITLASAVDGGLVQLPLYLEIGYGTATFAGLSCTALDNTQTQVTLNVTPGLANAWVGNVTAADMTNFTQEPSPGAATLLNIPPLLTVAGTASASVANTAPVPVLFTSTDIENMIIHATSTTDYTASLLSSLIGGLQMKVTILGLNSNTPAGLTSAISAALVQAEQPVDQLISSVLQSAGVNLGVADTWVSGANCAPAALSE